MVCLFIYFPQYGDFSCKSILQNYDKNVDKSGLCGPPTENKNVDLGITLAKVNSKIFGSHHRSRFLQSMTFKRFTMCLTMLKMTGYVLIRILWTNTTATLCVITDLLLNGFLNLYGLMKKAFIKERYLCKNPDLPVLLIGGKDDPVIQNEKKFTELKQFLESNRL